MRHKLKARERSDKLNLNDMEHPPFQLSRVLVAKKNIYSGRLHAREFGNFPCGVQYVNSTWGVNSCLRAATRAGVYSAL
jgi:hypothetical protein